MGDSTLSEAQQNEKPSLMGIGTIRRRAVSVSREELVTQKPLFPGSRLPLVVEPAAEVSLKAWAASNRELIDTLLLQHGGILFRGFGVRSDEEFEQIMRSLTGELIDYTYRSTPRQQVSGKVYTSTEYPADQSIPMHNEMSYASTWPQKIWFLCAKAAEEGGETPIADSRGVYERIDPAVRRRFAERGVMYVRNYGDGLDLSWQDVFQTQEKSAVEEICRRMGIELEWKDGGNRLRTRQVCQAVLEHPRTGDLLWFNQAHLFHASSLPVEMRDTLLATFQEEGLPRNAYYGDGSRIGDEALAEIRRAYAEESVVFPWREGDLLMLDNLRVAHGRRPYAGRRRVVVGMAEPMGPGM
jgi:alpha-ketoglutarate-dependent taurine dioxygenase